MIEEAQQRTRERIRDRLQERMRVSRMDIPKLVTASGVSRAMIYKILNCTSSASSDTLTLLAAALEIPEAVLLS